jgi:GntR family transcriptional regulator
MIQSEQVAVPIQIDFRSGIPIYIQIMEQIRQMVAHGDLKPGEQLPTMRQLAIELKVNWNTVARAYRLLDEAGLISTQQGRGTFIWETPSDEITRQLRAQTLEGLTRRYLAEAARLGVSPQEVLRFFQQEIAAWEQGNLPQETNL